MLLQSQADSKSELILTTLESYRQGCTKPIENRPESSGDLFSYNLQTKLESSLPLTDRLLMRCGAKARSEGLLAARRGHLVIAERYFAEARATLESNRLSFEGKLLYKSFLEQSQAYLDYCRGDFDRVHTRTLEALAIDILLEEEYGYDILLLHRIQLLHNLVRTDARCMRRDSALQLASQLLGYLAGRLEVLPILAAWGFDRLARQPKELVGVMFAQITGEVALILAGENRQFVGKLFAVVTRYLDDSTDDNSLPHPQANAWLLMKQAFVKNDISTFLEHSSKFLAQGRADTPLLWYATVIDLVDMCDTNVPESELVKQEVFKDATTWKYLPQKLLALLQN